MKKKLVCEYIWSLMDRLLFYLGIIVISSILIGTIFTSKIYFFTAAFSAICFALLLLIRKHIFSPANLFTRLRDTVSRNILEPKQLIDWNKWSNQNDINSMEDLYVRATAMLDSIDDFYTCLISPEPVSARLTGRKATDYGLSFGIKRTPEGLLILDKNGNLLPEQDDQGHPKIQSIIYASPAYHSGLRPGDMVISIDQRETADRSLGQLYNLPQNKSVISLDISRSGKQITVKLPLKQKTIPSITWRTLANQIGYLRLEIFENISVDSIKRALQNLKNSSAYIIDLRGNRGGDIRNALLLLSAFINEGVLAHCTRRDEEGQLTNLRYRLTAASIVIEIKDSDGFISLNPEQPLKRISDFDQRNKPIVVLVDSYSMSGAELFAGAMKDSNRAHILGAKTFGKGVGQDVFSIPPYVKVSVSSMRFTTPSGLWPGDGGISVCYGIGTDQEFSLPDGTLIGGPEDLCLTKAIEYLTAPIEPQ